MTVEVPEHFNFNIISLFCMPLVFNTPCTYPKKAKLIHEERSGRCLLMESIARIVRIASAGYDANAV